MNLNGIDYTGCRTYADFRMREWGMDKQPRRLQACVRRVLNELDGHALLCLKDRRLEVQVLPEFACESNGVWAYYPIPASWTKAAWALMARGMTYGKYAELLLATKPQDADVLGRRLIIMQVLPRMETRVLLVFSLKQFKTESARDFEAGLQDRLGHVLLFLRSPKAWNDCGTAMEEWRASILTPVRRKLPMGRLPKRNVKR